YYFVREMSFGQDGNFSWESMVDRYNVDLANDFGNLASRVLSMATRYLDGVVPDGPSGDDLTDADRSLREVHSAALADMERAVDDIAPHEALRAAWRFVGACNAYVEDAAPWKLAKDPDARRRLEVVLYVLLDSLRELALMTSPITPKAAQELWERLGLEGRVDAQTFASDVRLVAGGKVRTGDPLFPRLDDPSPVS
ncbi:MAG: class I tRNA ligase family protein, partial [Actinomycetota bacterium]|nr:class I tRNA ligase family protein [Actinomycetota bacterium]